jgi:hypothetical protein
MAAVKEDQVPVVAAGSGLLHPGGGVSGAHRLRVDLRDGGRPGIRHPAIAELSSSLPEGAGPLITSQLQQIVETSSTALSWTAVGRSWARCGAHRVGHSISSRRWTPPTTRRSRGASSIYGAWRCSLTLVFMLLGALALGLIVVVPPLLESWLAPADVVTSAISIGRFLLLAGVLLGGPRRGVPVRA